MEPGSIPPPCGRAPSMADFLEVVDEELATCGRRLCRSAEDAGGSPNCTPALDLPALLRREARRLDSTRHGLEVFVRAASSPVCRMATDMAREVNLLASIFIPLAQRQACRLIISSHPGARFRWMLDAMRVRQITGNLICHALEQAGAGEVHVAYSEWRSGEIAGIRFAVSVQPAAVDGSAGAETTTCHAVVSPGVVKRLCLLLHGHLVSGEPPEPILRFDLPCCPADGLLPANDPAADTGR